MKGVFISDSNGDDCFISKAGLVIFKDKRRKLLPVASEMLIRFVLCPVSFLKLHSFVSTAHKTKLATLRCRLLAGFRHDV